MARRRSEFEDFANSFKTFYGLTQKVGAGIEQAMVSDDEFKGADGGALTGRALDSARVKRRAEILSRWGDTEGGLKLRLLDAQAHTASVGADNAAKIAALDVRGKELGNEGQEYSNQFSSRSMDARLDALQIKTDMDRSRLGVQVATAPTQVLQAAAGLDSTLAGTAAARQNTSQKAVLFPGILAQQKIDLDQSQQTLGENQQTSRLRVGASNTQNQTTIDAAEQVKTDRSESRRLFGEAATMFGQTGGNATRTLAAQTQVIKNIRNSKLSLPQQERVIAAVEQMGLGGFLKQIQTHTLDATKALQDGGARGWVEWYSQKPDGKTFEYRPGADGTAAIVEIDENNPQNERVIVQGKEAHVAGYLAKMSSDLSAAAEFSMKVAQHNMTASQTASQTKRLDNQDAREAEAAARAADIHTVNLEQAKKNLELSDTRENRAKLRSIEAFQKHLQSLKNAEASLLLTEAQTEIAHAKLRAAGNSGMSAKDHQKAYTAAVTKLLGSDYFNLEKPDKQVEMLKQFQKRWVESGGVAQGLGQGSGSDARSSDGPGVPLQLGPGWKITPK